MNENTKDYIIIALFLILIGLMIYFNSCNKPSYVESSLKELKQLVIDDTTKAGINKRQADSTLRAIFKNDSIHNVTINNIFTNGTKEKKQILQTLPDTHRVFSIQSYYDSVARANR